jgi:AhpD family alkylhydroperoxidase
MSRIEAVQREQAGPFTRLVFRIAERQSGGKLPEPIAVQAHHPLLMNAYGAFELAFQRSKKLPERLKALAELKAAALAGCEWCCDFGTWFARDSGITEEHLRDLPRFRESDVFTEEEKLVLEYAEGITRTPVEVPDELFARLRARFDEGQLVELTYAAAIENLRARFNWALGIASQDYSEGAFCVRPEAAQAEKAS